MKRFIVMSLVLAPFMLGAGCDDDYPPCSPDSGIPQGPGAPTGPTDPRPLPNPDPWPSPDGADPDPKYRTNESGEVCVCGIYEIGCVDSPGKARSSAQPGAYCPYPRESDDPVIRGPVTGEAFRDPSKPYCKCWWTMYDMCGGQHAQDIEIYGDSVDACVDKLSELLNGQNSRLREKYPDATGHDLDSIQCTSR